MPQITTQNVTGNVTLLYGAKGNEATPLLVVNLDQTNTVWVGNTSLVTAGGSLGVPLLPQTSMSFDGSSTLYAVANAGIQLQVALIPGGTSYFLPASLSNLGGSKVFVQSGTPTGNIPLNSIWFNTASNALETWDGTAWVNESFNAQNLIQAATILGTQIAAQAITFTNLQDGSVGNQKIAAQAITTSKISPQAVTASQVANGTLTTAQIAAAAGILGTQIANATITSANIAAHTIVAGNIAANTITASQLAAGIVYAGIVNGTTITGSLFQGNGSGLEFALYTGTPGAGNLFATASTVNGTDGFGNPIRDGFTSYGPNSGVAQLAANQTSGEPFLVLRPSGSSHVVNDPQIFGGIGNAGAVNEFEILFLYSGTTSSGSFAELQLISGSDDGTTIPVFRFFVGGVMVMQGDANNIIMGGPIFGSVPGSPGTQENWHSVALPSGWTGTIRVKALAEGNFACIDINCSFTDSSTGTNYTAGSLPSAGYYPTTRTQQPLTVNQGVGTAATLPRVNIPTSGAIQILMPGFAVNGQTCLVFGTVIYPLD